MPYDVEIRFKRLQQQATVPVRSSPAATGFDLHACLDAPLELAPAPQLVPTGLAIEFPAGWDVQIRPRSGLSLKGIGVAFGTIDADYRGELLVTMWTFGALESYTLQQGDRIAQLVIARIAAAAFTEVADLAPSTRGEGGHGSTGR
jgi:dUTP pyrophosphatase